jgi:hypothetical protein
MVYTFIYYYYVDKRGEEKKELFFSHCFLVFIQAYSHADVAFLHDVVFVSILHKNVRVFISKKK